MEIFKLGVVTKCAYNPGPKKFNLKFHQVYDVGNWIEVGSTASLCHAVCCMQFLKFHSWGLIRILKYTTWKILFSYWCKHSSYQGLILGCHWLSPQVPHEWNWNLYNMLNKWGKIQKFFASFLVLQETSFDFEL